MCRRSYFIVVVLMSGLVFGWTRHAFADADSELRQAQSYDRKGDYEQAEAAYRQVVIAYPDTKQALTAQKELTILHVFQANETEARAAMAKLLTDFAEREDLPLAVHGIAEKCGLSREDKRIWQICRDMFENAPADNGAIWSKMGLGILSIYLGDQLSAQAQIDLLIAGFSTDQRSAEALDQLAWTYRKQKRYTKAAELYQFVADNWSNKPRAIFSHRGLVYCKFALGDEVGAWTAVQSLLSRFATDEHVAEVAQSLGREYDRKQQRDKARILYEYVLTKHPNSFHAMWAQRGLVLINIETGNYTGAEAGIDMLLAKYPDHNDLPQAMLWLGNDYYKVNQNDKATRCYAHVVSNNPQSQHVVSAHKGLILSLAKLGDTTATNIAIDRLLAEIPNNEDVAKTVLELADQCRRNLSAHTAARRLYRGLLTHCADSAHAMWAQRGIIYIDIKSGDYEAAESGIEMLLADYPNHDGLPQAMEWLGNDYSSIGQYKRAIQCYTHVVNNSHTSQYAIGDSPHVFWAQKGIVIAEIRDGCSFAAEEALSALKANHSTNKSLPGALLEIGQEYQTLGDAAHAISVFDTIVTDYANSKAAIWAQSGLTVLHIGAGDYAVAETDASRLLSNFADSENLGEVVRCVFLEYESHQRYKEAKQLVQDALAAQSNVNLGPMGKANIARLYILCADDSGAETVFSQIVAEHTDDPLLVNAVHRVAEGYYEQAVQQELYGRPPGPRSLAGELPERASVCLQHAIEKLRMITDNLPEKAGITPEAHYLCSECYRIMGRPELMVAHCDIVCNKWPDYENAGLMLLRLGNTYLHLKAVGAITASDADPIIRHAFEQITSHYGDMPASDVARNWLEYHPNHEEGAEE